MTKRLRGFISFLLVLVLCFGMIPNVSAAEIGATESITETEATEATTAETAAPPDETSPTETSAETTPPTEESTTPTTEATIPVTEPDDDVFSDIVISSGVAAASTDDYGIMTAASTQSGILLFDFADNGNYTTVLNSQLSVSYKPNGSGTTRTAYIKNLGWHFARYNNVPHADDPLYCIEPWRNYGASTSGNSVDRDVTLSGSGSSTGSSVWYSMPAARREAIGLILLYSDQMWDDSVSVFSVKRDSNPNVPLRIATQFLIYEIVCGLRDAETFTLNYENECGTDGDIFYNAGVAAVSNFAPNYNTLVSYVQSAMEIPSFTSNSSSTAPTITLTGDETSVYDSNGVLSNFSITDGNGAEFYKSGNTLYIYQTGTISSSTVFKATRYIPSASNSTYNIWYMSGSSYQTTISLASPSSGNLNAYFKLKAPSAAILGIQKTTEDGKNLSGWQFGIYSNSACTSLISGPHTTDSNGAITVPNLAAGTVYVKELGHSDSTIDAIYSCTSTNPQKVTLTAGQTSSVSFYNELDPSGLELTKTTEDGKNLEGWQFGIYSNSACTSLISGPHTTDANGKIFVSDLSAGTVYVKELGHKDSSINALYTCSSENPQEVTLIAGQAATVSFHNVLNTGGVKLVKETNTGENLAGWKIGLYYDADCTQAVDGSPFVTGADGTITVSDLEPGTLYAKEIPADDPYWDFDTEVKEVTIAVNQTATVTFTNTHNGRIEFRKTTNTGNHLGGWTFRVQDSNYDVVGEYTTDENGYACTENLPLGRYTVIELQTDDLYWNFELGFHDVTVKAGETVVDEWLNREQGLGWFHKKTNTGESVEGWHITIYADEACTQEIRTMITNEDGRTGYYMDPGIYWAKETGDEYGRFEDEYWMVDETVQKFEIKPHEDTEIIFTNVQYGKVKILKTMEGEGSVAGWQFKITDAEGKEIEGSPFTSDENGEILTKVLPGKYTIEELIPKDSLYHCTSENPQTVTIAQGQTAEVTFTNALRPGKITLDKVDIKGNSLAGATFLLEWSEDGSIWWPIEYSDSETVEEGCCSNPNVVDGLLTTGSDGKLVWDNLHPGLQYRLTETKAPRGFSKLRKPAYEGELPEEDFSLEVKVINSRTFTLPETGSVSLMLSSISMSGCLLGLIASMLYLRKKEQ